MKNRTLHIIIVLGAILFSSSWCSAGQAAIKREGKADAEAFVAASGSLIGQSKDSVIAAIGMPASVVKTDNIECWRYRKLFGAYRRRKAIFGHISLCWEVRLELVLKDGVVTSAKPSNIREVHRQKDDVVEESTNLEVKKPAQ